MRDEISKAIDSAVVRTCEECNSPSMRVSGEYMIAGKSVDSGEVRQMLDIWWRFNLVTGNASGDSNAFAEGYHFESA